MAWLVCDTLLFICIHRYLLALVAYEYAITFQGEIDVMWRNKWTAGKVLFLLTRYMMLLNVLAQCLPTPSYDVSGDSSRFAGFTWCWCHSRGNSTHVLRRQTISEWFLVARLWQRLLQPLDRFWCFCLLVRLWIADSMQAQLNGNSLLLAAYICFVQQEHRFMFGDSGIELDTISN